MTRRLEPVDLMVAIGLFATVAGIYLLSVATHKTLSVRGGSAVLVAEPIRVSDASEWIQPVVGQAIVDQELVSRRAAHKISQAASAFSRALSESHTLADTKAQYTQQLRQEIRHMEADQAARVQFVMGRSIVNFTERGLRVGMLSVEHMAGPYNGRMIGIVKTAGDQMQTMFRERQQQRLGEAIVTDALGWIGAAERIQPQLGAATLRLIAAQEQAQQEGDAIQEQLAAGELAVMRTEQQTALLDRSLGQGGFPLAQARSWPEVPLAALIAASVALLGMFLAGLTMPTMRRAEVTEEEGIVSEPVTPRYRKTA